MPDATDYRMRRAVRSDAQVVAKWLENPLDCRMAIGHAPFTVRDFEDWLKADDQVGWVLEGAEGPLGYGEIWVDAVAKDLELAHLVVSPEYRNRGWGRLLTHLLFDRGRPYGFPLVYMRIYSDNHQALKSYVAAGFTRVSTLTPDMDPAWVWLSRSYDKSG